MSNEQATTVNDFSVIIGLADEDDGNLTVEMHQKQENLPEDAASLIVAKWLATNWISICAMAKRQHEETLKAAQQQPQGEQLQLLSPSSTVIGGTQ